VLCFEASRLPQHFCLEKLSLEIFLLGQLSQPVAELQVLVGENHERIAGVLARTPYLDLEFQIHATTLHNQLRI